MKKQTAVDWLVKEFNLESFEATIKLAKSREKDQILDAYYNGGAFDDLNKDEIFLIAQQFYNESYENE
jgi:hypothetical protein